MAKRKTSILVDLNDLFIAVPWWVGPIVVLAVYGLFEYLVPQLIPKMLPESDNPIMASANKTTVQIIQSVGPMFAPWAAGLVLVVWLASLMQKWNRRNLLRQLRNRRQPIMTELSDGGKISVTPAIWAKLGFIRPKGLFLSFFTPNAPDPPSPKRCNAHPMCL